MLWADPESAPNNVRNRTTSTLFDTMHQTPILSEHGFGLQTPVRMWRRTRETVVLNLCAANSWLTLVFYRRRAFEHGVIGDAVLRRAFEKGADLRCDCGIRVFVRLDQYLNSGYRGSTSHSGSGPVL